MGPLLTLLCLFVFCHARGPEVTYRCPQEAPTPCKCTDAYGSVFLECSGLARRQQLDQAFRKMAGLGITELAIRDSNVSHIPRDLFRDSPVSRIKVTRSTMIYLFDRELEHSADAVTEIELDAIDFEGGLDWDVLDNLGALRSLSVKGSALEVVPYSTSELELPVETLVLEGNHLEQVHERAFQKFRRLTNLKLNDNLLTRYERTMLPLSECRLQFLDLSHNKLTSLPEDAFDGMDQLHSLLLRGNKLKTLEKSYMEKVYQSLFYFDVANNPLVCSCDMTWLLSEKKPFHLFGECTTLQAAKKQNLKEITKEDFAPCYQR